MGSSQRFVAFGLLVLLVLLGCNGIISEPGASGGGGGGGPWIGPTPTAVPGAGHVDAEDGIRRLTNAEYDNAVRALFGEITYRNALTPDTRTHGYDRIAEGLTISPQHIDGYAQTAVSVANAVIADDASIERWMDCDAASLPSRIRERSAVQQGGDLVCSYNANCYRPDDDVSYPNRNSSGSDAPGRIHYEESVPAPGRYRMTIRAHLNETVGDAVLEVRHGELGVLGSFSPDGDAYRDYDIEFDVPDAGIVPLTIEWVAPIISPARRVHIDTITMTGPIGGGSDGGSMSAAEQLDCAGSLVDRLGPRTFRRPLTAGEGSLLMETYAAGAVDGFWDGMRMVLELLLQSPQFLYVVEVGTPATDIPGYYRLDAYELAARLSFLAWQAPPDDQLWGAAASGALDAEAGIHSEAERLFADPRAQDTVQRFYEQWLELDEVLHAERQASLFPEFTPALREAMLEETRHFLDDAIWVEGAGLDDVLTAQHTFVDEELANLYGVDAPSEPFGRVDLPAERIGLLTRAALLTARAQSNQTSPVQRGIFVLEQLLCVDLPTPPEGVDINPPSVEEGTPRTTRERWAQHSEDPSCRGCHELIDPVGFTLEGFDPIGRFRAEENGLPIDTAGGIPSVEIEDGTIADAAELGQTLAALPEVNDCFARQWLRFGLGRLERDTDAGDVAALSAALSEGGIREMLLSLIDTAAFRHRVVEEEVAR